jgi:hypothetical protein
MAWTGPRRQFAARSLPEPKAAQRHRNARHRGELRPMAGCQDHTVHAVRNRDPPNCKNSRFRRSFNQAAFLPAYPQIQPGKPPTKSARGTQESQPSAILPKYLTTEGFVENTHHKTTSNAFAVNN